jgi:RND family efflux transporter MFP subunit
VTAARIVLRTLVLLCPVLAFGCGGDDEPQQGGPPGDQQGPPPAQVRFAPIRMESVAQTRRVTGSLRAKQRSNVANIEPGRVVAVEFDEGQTVELDDVLIRIDSRRLDEEVAGIEADVAAAEATVAEREAELQLTRTDLQSRESAANRAPGAVSEIELQTARTAVSVAESRVEAAQKQLAAVRKRLDGVQVRLEDTTVRTPFAGSVLSRDAELGEFLNSGDTIGTVISDGTYEAVLDAPESLDPRFLDEATAVIRLDVGGTELEIEKFRVVGDLDPRSRRYSIVADVRAPDGIDLLPGMSVTAELPAGGDAPRLIVPTDALLRNANGFFVYLALDDENGTIGIPQPVDVAFRRSGDAILTTEPQGPFQPGMRVVREGGERIFFPGQPLAEAPPIGGDVTAPPAPPATRPEGAGR